MHNSIEPNNSRRFGLAENERLARAYGVWDWKHCGLAFRPVTSFVFWIPTNVIADVENEKIKIALSCTAVVYFGIRRGGSNVRHCVRRRVFNHVLSLTMHAPTHTYKTAVDSYPCRLQIDLFLCYHQFLKSNDQLSGCSGVFVVVIRRGWVEVIIRGCQQQKQWTTDNDMSSRQTSHREPAIHASTLCIGK